MAFNMQNNRASDPWTLVDASMACVWFIRCNMSPLDSQTNQQEAISCYAAISAICWLSATHDQVLEPSQPRDFRGFLRLCRIPASNLSVQITGVVMLNTCCDRCVMMYDTCIHVWFQTIRDDLNNKLRTIYCHRTRTISIFDSLART